MSFSGQPAPQAFGGRALAIAPQPMPAASGTPFDNGSALAVAPQVEESRAEESKPALDVNAIREAVLQAMETGGSQMLLHALEEGQWAAEGKLASIHVQMSPEMIQVSYTREQEKLSNQAATRVAGRAVKVRLVSQSAAHAELNPAQPGAGRAPSRDSIKTRAADEPVVKRMMEKFGAEIRIVMDRSER
jgi:hypothetical protein